MPTPTKQDAAARGSLAFPRRPAWRAARDEHLDPQPCPPLVLDPLVTTVGASLGDRAAVDRLMRARQITKERTGSIRSGEPGRRRQVAYWLSVVKDLAKTG